MKLLVALLSISYCFEALALKLNVEIPKQITVNILDASFLQVHLTPEKFAEMTNSFVVVRGYLGSGSYKELYFSESNSKHGYSLDGLTLKFSNQFKEKYNIDECNGLVVNVVGKIYKEANSLGGIKDIISVTNTEIKKITLKIDTTTCYFEDLLFSDQL